MPFDARAVDQRIRRAMRILENEQTLVPSAAAIAERVGLSVAHFSRMFAKQIGQVSSAYGRRIRLDHSINRLRYDPSSIGEVANDFGYESQAAFTRAFNEQFGASPRDYMRRLAALPSTRFPLPGPVRVVNRDPTPLAARRFFGDDQGSFWRKFLDELPDRICEKLDFIGLSYDDPRVTPPQHQRYDCCFVLREPWRAGMALAGLDAIELPGGLHGEIATIGDPGALRLLFHGLFSEWLPTRSALAPEGDPLPTFFEKPPFGGSVPARVAIRVRQRADDQRYNAALLDTAD